MHHHYIIGRTGHGKSTYLETLARRSTGGFLFLDPHGDSAERLRDIASYWNPADGALGFNPLRDIPKGQRHLAANDVVSSFKAIWGDSWGPRLEWIAIA